MTPSHPDPLPGDFDEELGNLDSSDVQVVQPSRAHHLIVQLQPKLPDRSWQC